VSGALSLKATSPVEFHTGETVRLAIGGRHSFDPGFTGWALLAMYANLKVPRPGTPGRQALARGGWRAWFQQATRTEADGQDETGYLGPVPIPSHGDKRILVSHMWPHTVDTDDWQFCLEVDAYGPSGVAMRVPLVLGTREVKILRDPRS
jgi:hypothetical protein